MLDTEVLKAVSQETVSVTLSTGEYAVKPLTVRRSCKLLVLFNDIQGDQLSLRNPESAGFQQAVTLALIATGNQMPAALELITGDERLGKLEDISLPDLSAIVLAAAKANKVGQLIEGIRQVTQMLRGETQPQ